MTDHEIRDVVTSVLRALAPEAGFESAEVTFESDWDGEPIIRVRARFSRRPNDSDILIDAAHIIRTALLERGEERFVFSTFDIVSERRLEPEDVD